MKFLKISLFIALSLFLIMNAYATGFYGYTKNATGTYNALSNTSVAIYEYGGGMGPSATLLATYINYSDSNGFFNISNIEFNGSNSYKPVVRHYYGDYYVDYIGQSLPDFPGDELTNLNNVTFYLKEAANINISAINSTGGITSFDYFIKDTKLGYPIAENFTQGPNIPPNNNVTLFVPADRNYTIAIYPYHAVPLTFELNNLSDYTADQKPIVVNVKFNTTNINKKISGYVLNSSNMNESYNNLTIVAYIIDPGDMLFKSHPMPYNMSQWHQNEADYVNLTGEFIIQVPGAPGIVGDAETGVSVMLFAIAQKGSSYYGAFRNITLTASQDNVTDFNLTLQELLGSASTLSYSDASGPTTNNFTLKEVAFKMYYYNSTSGISTELNMSAHIEVRVDYSSLANGPRAFSWMIDPQSNSTFKLPMYASQSATINVFSNNYQLKDTITAADISGHDFVQLNLSSFQPGEIDEGETVSIYIEMLKNSDECNVPYPPSNCSLTSSAQFGVDFSPLSVVMGGGRLNFKIRNQNNVTVIYRNVDLLASGPPDALFDSNANESSSGASLEEAWRFGSKGPEIYDDILIGIPYNDSQVDESAPISILIDKLLDNDWNHLWNTSSNTSAQIPSDYSGYNNTWFNTTIDGMPCTTNQNDNCYINISRNEIWLKIPHFSGTGLTTKTTTKGNFSITTNATEVECKTNCIIYINATNLNYTLAQSLHNITINNTDSGGLVDNFTIYYYNGSTWLYNGTNVSRWTNYNVSLFNGTNTTMSRYIINISKSKGLKTLWSFSYYISGLNDTLNLEINLTCTSEWTCGSWSSCVSSQKTRTCTDTTYCNTSTGTETADCSSGASGTTSGGASSTTSKTWLSLEKGEIATMSITSSNVHVRKITVKMENAADKMKIDISKLSSEPSSVNESIEGEVYQYLSINEYFINNTAIDNIEFEFRVENSWLADNNIDKEDIVLMHYKDDIWEEVSTEITNEDTTYVYYKATAESFSYYAIAQKVEEVVSEEEEETAEEQEETIEEAPEVTEEKEEVAEEVPPKKELPLPLWAIITLAAIFVAFIVVLVYYVRKERF